MEEQSLFSLLKKYSICIPSIQREYVQGFDDKKTKEIRDRFLADIFLTLRDNNSDNKLKINIIYGYCNNNNFYPIDGQQRLTTLYLLHWFLYIKSNNQNAPFFASNRIHYEIRRTADLFLGELANGKRYDEFQEMINSKELFSNMMVLKVWFKSSWLNDPTVLSILNVISELKQEDIDEQIARKYLDNLKSGKICFDFLISDEKDAKKRSVEDYIKLNSRGKQIDIFDGVKAQINLIEKQLDILSGDGFVGAYDGKYIDLFYDLNVTDKKTLEQITSDINNATLNFLINSYNLYVILGDNHEKSFIMSYSEYYSLINSKAFLENDKDKEDAKEHFEFVNNTLETILKLGAQYCKDELDLFFNSIIYFNENYHDGEGVMAQLIYFNFYRLYQKNIASLDCIKKFKYILQNLNYSNWNQTNLKNIINFCTEVSSYCDIMKYFSEKIDSDIYSDMKIIIPNAFPNDIKRRIKEQLIKITVCKRNSFEYNHFDYLEKIFPEQRSIYFLLQFAQLWDDFHTDYPEEKNTKLALYMDTAKKIFSINPTMELRKLFAVATFYNETERKMQSSDWINERAGYRYIVGVNKNNENILDEQNNLHYWDNNYYFISDNMLEKEKKIKRIKLVKLKLAYDLYRSKEANMNYDSLTEELKSKDYNGCWLQPAIRKNYQELLVLPLKTENAKVQIQIEIDEFHYQKNKKYINFFAYLYMKDKDGWYINKYTSAVYDLSTVNVRDTLSYKNYVDFDRDIGKGKLINAFELKLLWQTEKEIYVDSRTFFYSKHLIEIIGDSDTLISVEEDKIIKRVFNLQDYIEYHYDFNNDKKIIKEKKLEELKKIKAIEDSYEKYLKKRNCNNQKISNLESLNPNKETNRSEIDKLNKEIECALGEYNDLIYQSYNLEKLYYRSEKISKYLYKDVFMRELSKNEFVLYKDINKEF